MLVAAKKRGEQELLARRERLKLELEKLGRRTDEFPHYSEMDMIQQVQYWHVQMRGNSDISSLLLSCSNRKCIYL